MRLATVVAAASLALAVRGAVFESRPGTGNCTLSWFTQTVDHFSWVPPAGGGGSTYQQVLPCHHH